MKIPHVHTKRAKGKLYFYYATGAKNAKGRPILTPLPAPSDPTFPRKLADAKRARTMRGERPAAAMTINRLADLYERSDKFRGHAETTQRLYLIGLNVIREQIGPMPADALRRQDAQLLMDTMADRPGAANSTIRTLGALYSWGRKRGHAAADPVREIEMLPMGEHDPWPESLLNLALEAKEPLVRNTVALLYYTAQRIGDVLKLRWSDVANGRVRVKQGKTGTDLDFAQHPELSAILSQIPRTGLTVISKPDGRPYTAGRVRALIQEWAAKQGADIVPHGLRKNAVNALFEAGCSPTEVAAISGQSMAMLEHYSKRRNRSKLGDSAVIKWGRKG